MRKKIGKLLMGIVCFTVLLTACGKKEAAPSEEKIKVVTSSYPMYDFTKRIAGDTLNVVNLVPPGVEPHDWEPSVQDIAQLEEAKAFIFNGAGMEIWVNKVLDSLKNKDLMVLEASSGVDLIKAEEEHDHDHDGHDHDHDHEHHDHDHGEWDPHVWLSLRAAQMELVNIKDFLVELNPADKKLYEENYKVALQEFQALDKEYQEKLAPFAGKEIVVAHEAFAYLCRDYKLKQLGIEGVFADSEPSPAKMKEIIDFVRKHNVKVIFFESLASPKVAEAIAKETGARTEMLNPLEGLTEEEIAEGKDYLSVMKSNLKALEGAFTEK